jgi:hypothetical protein
MIGSWEAISCASAENFSTCYETERLLLCSQEPSSYPGPDKTSPYHSFLYILKDSDDGV